MLDPLTSLHVHSRETIVSGTIMTILTTVFVFLRFASKRANKTAWAVDDWLIGAAQLLWYVQYGLQIHGMKNGQQATGYTDPHFLTFYKFDYIYGEFYFPIVLLTNMSIVFFYRSVFAPSVNRSFHYLSIGVIVLHFLWAIPCLFVESFFCTPIQIFWTDIAEIPEKCIYYSTYWILMSIFEIVLDFIVLTLPIREIMKLKLSSANRSMLLFMFLLGSFVIVTGITRISVSWEYGNEGIDAVLEIFWLHIHIGTAIICACLPTCRPLVRKIGSLVPSVLKYGTKSRTAETSQTSQSHKSGVLPIYSNSEAGNYAQFSGNEIGLVESKRSGEGSGEEA